LLELISETPETTAREQLTLLAKEAGAEDLESFFELGIDLYENLISQRTLLPAS